MKYLLLFLLIPLGLISQNDTVFIKKNITPYFEKSTYKTDTIIFHSFNERNILIGNSILPESKAQQKVKDFGLFLADFKVGGCKKSEKPSANAILRVERYYNKWLIKVRVSENCCQSFLADISIENEDTLNLKYSNYGNRCACSCPYELTYELNVKKDSENLKKIKCITIDGEALLELIE